MKVFARDGNAYKEVAARALRDEDELQQLFEQNPNLVPWALDERRVLAREVNTAAGPIDHVGLDAQGEIVLLETKLARNQTRRHVLGQALDYASQLTKFGAQELLDKMRERVGYDFTEAWFSSKPERDAFQRSLEANLRYGRMTIIIVMDEAEELLKDAVRFLNRATAFNCILAEVRLTSDGTRDLVAVETYGEETADEKATTDPATRATRTPIDEGTFIMDKERQGLGEEARAFLAALQWAKGLGIDVRATPKGYALFGSNHTYWYVESLTMDVWAEASVYEARKRFLEGAVEPWARRIKFKGPIKGGAPYGKVATVNVKGATREDFERLFDFLSKGP